MAQLKREFELKESEYQLQRDCSQRKKSPRERRLIPHSCQAQGIIPLMEYPIYQDISAIPDFGDYMVPLLDNCRVKNGFAMKRGQSFIGTADILRKEDTEALKAGGRGDSLQKFISIQARHLLWGLGCLHRNGWCHRDIRPNNLVLLDGI